MYFDDYVYICGEILNNPIGSDVIYDDGCVLHVAALGYNPGCMNDACENYKKWGE